MKTISVECAGRLIDFAPSMEQRGREFARDQLHGSVAVHNMLARNRVTYLADEVGMGKTYVALGAMALLRHFHPRARIIVIAPRQNIQRKWVKEYRNFVEDNWKVKDNAVCAIQGGPDRPLVHCESLYEMAKVLSETMQRDLFLRMTSFSPALRSRESKEPRALSATVYTRRFRDCPDKYFTLGSRTTRFVTATARSSTRSFPTSTFWSSMRLII